MHKHNINKSINTVRTLQPYYPKIAFQLYYPKIAFQQYYPKIAF